MRAVEHERRLREAVDAALRIGRWRSTSKEQLLRMLEFALPEPQSPSCSCTDPDAGMFNRNCPVHGIVGEEAATIDLEVDSTEELEAEARTLRLRGHVTHIHRLASNDSAMEKEALLDLLDRLIRPPDSYLWLNED